MTLAADPVANEGKPSKRPCEVPGDNDLLSEPVGSPVTEL
jgi:hypothetical protein